MSWQERHQATLRGLSNTTGQSPLLPKSSAKTNLDASAEHLGPKLLSGTAQVALDNAAAQVAKRLLTIAEFSVWSGVCRTGIYALLNSGQLIGVKSGRLTMIPLAEAEAWAQRLPTYQPGAVVAQPSKVSKP